MRIYLVVALFVATLLTSMAIADLSATQAEEIEERRFSHVADELRGRLETELGMGLQPGDNPGAQAMLEAAVARTPTLVSIEMDSNDGIALLSSDRALRGLPAPPAWRAAMRATPGGWRVSRGTVHSVGSPLHDGEGRIAGYLVLTHRADTLGGNLDSPAANATTISALGLACAATVFGLAALAYEARLRRAQIATGLAALQRAGTDAGPFAEAAQQLGRHRDHLARAERDAMRIAEHES